MSKELYEFLLNLPAGIDLRISHAGEESNIAVIPLRDGEEIEDVPFLFELTPDGELQEYYQTKETEVRAVDCLK